jgi:hypothetical protein
MRIFVCIAACGLLAFGSVKYIQNEVIYGRPFVCNMDFNPNWLREDQGTYQGLASIYDVNILKLVQKPILDKSTQHSIPLIFYGTFWYDYITEPGLIGNRSNLTRRIGSYLDAVGVFPAILLMFGVVIAGGNLLRRLIVRADVIDGVACLEFASAIAFLGNVSMLLLVFCKFDAWSTLQARSLFPTIIGAFVLCDFALKWTNTKMRIAPIFGLWQSAFIVGSFGYFLAECVLEIL